MFTRLFSLIKESTKDTTKETTGNFSHTKISSYFILGSILSSTLVYLIIDIVNAIMTWQRGFNYVIPVEHISILVLVMSHHLVLLRLKNASEKTKLENDNGKYTFDQNSGNGTEDVNKKAEE